MKSIVKTICVLLSAVLLLAGCQTIEKITTLKGLDGKILAMASSPVSAEDARASVESRLGITLKDFRYFDNTAGAVAALVSGQVDAVFAPSFTGNYYAGQNDKIKTVTVNGNADSFAHMALRTADSELMEAINAAILDMKADGTLDKLYDGYITNLSEEPEGKDLPVLTGAPTVRVGISGDIPPLDFIAANGKPGGYCAELLTEISERANINFEVSNMSNEVKFTALTTNKIDVFFFHFINNNIQAMKDTIADNPSIALSEPYFSVRDSVFLVLK